MKLGKVVIIFRNMLHIPQLGIVFWVNGYLEVVAGEVTLPHPCSLTFLRQLLCKLEDVGSLESRGSVREDRTCSVVVESKCLKDQPLLATSLCHFQWDHMGKNVSKW